MKPPPSFFWWIPATRYHHTNWGFFPRFFGYLWSLLQTPCTKLHAKWTCQSKFQKKKEKTHVRSFLEHPFLCVIVRGAWLRKKLHTKTLHLHGCQQTTTKIPSQRQTSRSFPTGRLKECGSHENRNLKSKEGPTRNQWDLRGTQNPSRSLGDFFLRRKLVGGFTFFFTPKFGEMIELDEYFSIGLKPPTRKSRVSRIVFWLIWVFTFVDCYLIPQCFDLWGKMSDLMIFFRCVQRVNLWNRGSIPVLKGWAFRKFLVSLNFFWPWHQFATSTALYTVHTWFFGSCGSVDFFQHVTGLSRSDANLYWMILSNSCVVTIIIEKNHIHWHQTSSTLGHWSLTFERLIGCDKAITARIHKSFCGTNGARSEEWSPRISKFPGLQFLERFPRVSIEFRPHLQAIPPHPKRRISCFWSRSVKAQAWAFFFEQTTPVLGPKTPLFGHQTNSRDLYKFVFPL